MIISLSKYWDNCNSYCKKQWERINPSVPQNRKKIKSFVYTIWETLKPYVYHVLGIITVFIIISQLYFICLDVADHHIVGKVMTYIKTHGLESIIILSALVICVIIVLVKWDKFKSYAKENIVLFSLLLLYLFFYRYWESLIREHIIDAFLSNFEPNLLSDIIFVLAVVGSCFLCYFNRKKRIKQSTTLLCVIALAFWGYYRFHNYKLGLEKSLFDIDLKHLIYNEHIKYLDIVFVYAMSTLISPLFEKLINLLGKLIERIHKKSKQDEEKEKTSINGFIRDYPIDGSEDFLGRSDIAHHEMEKLLATDTTKGSFTYGIDAPWGSGKTSFMIMMKELVCPNEENKQKPTSKYDNITIIDFNPWLYSEENDLVKVFMDELSKNLKQYDLSLAKNIIDYSKLLSAFNTDETKIIASLIDLVHHECTLKEKKQQITEAIKRIQRKIVVFVDDLDRLDANEIMEMMKLIRNISDFPNMYFVAAYDKKYLIHCLNTIMPTKGADFIGKIFQHEYRLPPSSNIINSIAVPGYLEHLLSNDDHTKLFPKDGDKNQLPKISNLREAKRFTNSFSSHYANDMTDNKIKSYYLLEFFKIRYPLAFAFFESNWEMMITETETETETINGSNTYCELYGGISDHSSTNYTKFINNNYKKLGMNDDDKLIVENILSLLFGKNGFINSIDILRDYFN
ncbi:MAG: hypothetical protein IKZ92_07940 [Muribaculaceae bacterium]|nr:hypothetical protein [Muribaculaceae bacterium]